MKKLNHVKRILVVDDHPIFRHGVIALINGETNLQVCGEAASTTETLVMAAKLNPDLILLDISLEDGSGLEVIKDLQVQMPKLPILVLSMHEESIYTHRVLRAGAKGYIMKQQAPELVIEGIRNILNGGIFVSKRMTERLLVHFTGGNSFIETEPTKCLTDRELEVFKFIGIGKTTQQIAQMLHISTKTVETYRTRIKRKMEIENMTELVQHAVMWVNTYPQA